MSFRPATDDDLDTVCNFVSSAEELYLFYPKACYPLTCEQLKLAVAQREASTVMEVSKEVVGFANFYRWRDGVCSIGNVIIAPAYRGQGLAKQLISYMTELAISHYQAKRVTVSCFNNNLAGLLLYPKLGFKPYDIEQRVGSDGSAIALIHLCYQP